MQKTTFFSIGYIVIVFLLFLGGCTTISRSPREQRKATMSMVVTAYCPCGECCGWKRNWLGIPVYTSGHLKGKRKQVGITADGTRARVGTIAADLSRYPFGTQMYVPGYGWGVVHDTGSDIKGNHIDVFFFKHYEALNWGRKVLEVKVVWK